MSRRMIRRRLDRLELCAMQARAPKATAKMDLPDYEAMTDDELQTAYADAVAAYEASPEALAHRDWVTTLSDDQLVAAYRDRLHEGDRLA